MPKPGPTNTVTDVAGIRVGHATRIAAGADGKTRLLWSSTSGAASVWVLDGAGNALSSVSFGPYAGWTAQRTAAGSDGVTRVLWQKTDATAGLWLFGANNGVTSAFAFGPY